MRYSVSRVQDSQRLPNTLHSIHGAFLTRGEGLELAWVWRDGPWKLGRLHCWDLTDPKMQASPRRCALVWVTSGSPNLIKGYGPRHTLPSYVTGLGFLSPKKTERKKEPSEESMARARSSWSFALLWGALGTTRPFLMLHIFTDSKEKRKHWKNDLGSYTSIYRYTYTHIYVNFLSGASVTMQQCSCTKIRARAAGWCVITTHLGWACTRFLRGGISVLVNETKQFRKMVTQKERTDVWSRFLSLLVARILTREVTQNALTWVHFAFPTAGRAPVSLAQSCLEVRVRVS